MAETTLSPTVTRADVSTEPAAPAALPAPQRTSRPRRARRERIEPASSSAVTRALDQAVRARVIGQDQALDALLSTFPRFLAGLRDPGRPVITALLLGPTGVGKTETARALASALFGAEDGVLRIHCEEYAHGHEVAKLLGSPPGYVGYQIEPLLSQARLDAAHEQAVSEGRGLVSSERELFEHALQNGSERRLSLVLFDEIEKAHPTVWNALLGILDDGVVTLGNNQTVDFTHSIVLLTSNVGGGEISALLEPNRLGFQTGARAVTAPGALEEAALTAARRSFPAEFLNRFDAVRVYSPLDQDALERILDRLLGDLHRRALQAGVPMLLRLAAEARTLLLERGTDPRYGARPLRRALERELVDPLSRMVVAGGLQAGDVVEIEVEDGELAFFRLPAERQRLTAPVATAAVTA